MLQYFIDIIQIITAIVASIYFYKYKKSFLKYILYFSWYTVFNELAGYYLGDVLKKENGYIYNLGQIVLFILIYWILTNSIISKKRSKIINTLFFIYAISQVVEIIYKDFISGYLVVSYFIGGLVSLLGIMYYAIELLQSQKITHLRKNLAVWFLLGNLIFWIGYLPINIIFTNHDFFSDEVLESLSVIHQVFIVIQNVILIIGFIISEKISDNN